MQVNLGLNSFKLMLRKTNATYRKVRWINPPENKPTRILVQTFHKHIFTNGMFMCVCMCLCMCLRPFTCLEQLECQVTDQQCCVEDVSFFCEVHSSLI